MHRSQPLRYTLRPRRGLAFTAATTVVAWLVAPLLVALILAVATSASVAWTAGASFTLATLMVTRIRILSLPTEMKVILMCFCTMETWPHPLL